eukprot:9499-Amphidinium_carterae.1
MTSSCLIKQQVYNRIARLEQHFVVFGNMLLQVAAHASEMDNEVAGSASFHAATELLKLDAWRGEADKRLGVMTIGKIFVRCVATHTTHGRYALQLRLVKPQTSLFPQIPKK